MRCSCRDAQLSHGTRVFTLIEKPKVKVTGVSFWDLEMEIRRLFFGKGREAGTGGEASVT